MSTHRKSPKAKVGRPASGKNGKPLKLYINPTVRAHGEKLAHSATPNSKSLSALVSELIEREWASLQAKSAA